MAGHAAYPEAADLAGFLTGSGFPAGMVTNLATTDNVLAGIQAFETDCSRHFLAGSTIDNESEAEETRYFDPLQPPEHRLFFGPWNDIFSVTSVVYQTLPDGNPATLILNRDYFLEPVNNPARHRAYTHLRRGRWGTWSWGTGGFAWHPTENALQITGLWGYSDAIPDDAWKAMLMSATLAVEGQYRLGVTQGRTSYTAAQVTESFGVESYTNIIKGWQDIVGRTAANYRMLEL